MCSYDKILPCIPTNIIIYGLVSAVKGYKSGYEIPCCYNCSTKVTTSPLLYCLGHRKYLPMSKILWYSL